MKTAKKKIAVAMSGGVDSSVAAALLRDQGHEVTGMMLRLWSEPGLQGQNRCCTPESMELAKRAAAQLDIPFYVVDAREAFRGVVVEAFLDGYGRGETPNPCLECNRRIRWTFLLEHAMAMGADQLATGHYARVEQDGRGAVRLLRGADISKDQSYVLHVLSQDQLRHAAFPVGAMQKAEVRRLAARFSLPMAARRDSQDLCFLAGADYREFIGRHRPQMMVPGRILDSRGNAVGVHQGLARYTIGQRKGLHLSSPVPLYVLSKQTADNTVVVGTRSELGSRILETRGVNWIPHPPPSGPFRAMVKIRYTSVPRLAVVVPVDQGRRVQVIFEEPQRDITPGQAAVFYVDEAVIGGGPIQEEHGQPA